ncbi:MAG: hypothetical protein ACK559_11795, partial [bacterium]
MGHHLLDHQALLPGQQRRMARLGGVDDDQQRRVRAPLAEEHRAAPPVPRAARADLHRGPQAIEGGGEGVGHALQHGAPAG